MKSLILRIKKVLRTNKGETLMEAIVSILLLAILLTTITAMIRSSLNMTANIMQEAQRVQEELINPAFLATIDPANLDADEVSFTFTASSIVMTASHDVLVFDNTDNISAFYPIPIEDGGDP